MGLPETITALGTSIINLVGTRAKTDLSNITSAGETVIQNLAAGVPVGTVIAYMGTSAPDGFLLMDGGEYSKTTYAALYAVVGNSMGTATDSSKFVIADMTDGRYLMGSTVAGSRNSKPVMPYFSSNPKALQRNNTARNSISYNYPHGTKKNQFFLTSYYSDGQIQTDIWYYDNQCFLDEDNSTRSSVQLNISSSNYVDMVYKKVLHPLYTSCNFCIKF